MESFGRTLKRYLKYYKITQIDFAKRLSITQKQMKEIINGNTKLSIDLIESISLLTDIDVNYIMYLEQIDEMKIYLKRKFKTEKEVKKFLDSFHIKEMEKKSWLTLRVEDDLSICAIDLLNFLKLKNLDMCDKYFSDKLLHNNKNF